MAEKLNFAAQMNDVIDSYYNDVEKAINAEILNTANLIVKEIKIKGPKSSTNQKVHLRDSFDINVEKLSKDIKATIFSSEKGFIAHFLEYGTVNMRPQPFMRPAYDKHIPQMMKRIEKIISGGG